MSCSEFPPQYQNTCWSKNAQSPSQSILTLKYQYLWKYCFENNFHYSYFMKNKELFPTFESLMPCLQFNSHLGYPCGPPVAICKQCLVRGPHLLQLIWLAISFWLINQQPFYLGVWYREEKPRQRWSLSN